MPIKTTKPKAVLVSDKAMIALLTRKVESFRKDAKLKDTEGFIRGTGSYSLYGIDHQRNQLVVLADSPTSGDFNQYVTAKNKTDVVSRYDQAVEYRDVGSYSNPKVTIFCWTKSE